MATLTNNEATPASGEGGHSAASSAPTRFVDFVKTQFGNMTIEPIGEKVVRVEDLGDDAAIRLTLAEAIELRDILIELTACDSMKPVEFPEQTVVIGKDQPQYEPLPAHVYQADPEGRITCCWELSDEELAEVMRTKRIWHTVLTFGGPLQPQLLQVEKPEMG